MADPKLKLGNDIWATKQKSLLAYNDEGGNFKSLPFQVDRISGGAYVGRNGLIQYAASNEPRIDFLNNTKGGLLLEPQRTNLQVRSEEFDNISWTKANSTVSANEIISPDGALSGDKLIANTTTGAHYVQGTVSGLSTSSEATFSVFVKKGEITQLQLLCAQNSSPFTNWARLQFDLNTFSEFSTNIGTFGYEDYGNGWVRVFVTGTPTSTSALIRVSLYKNFSNAFAGNNIDGFYVFGAQLEQGNYPTSYIQTSSAAVTRVVDTCGTGENLSTLIGQSEGTLFIDFEFFEQGTTSSYQMPIGLYNSGGSGTQNVRIDNYSGKLRIYVISSGGTRALWDSSNSISNVVANQRYKVAIRYKNGDSVSYVNGQLYKSDSGAVSGFNLVKMVFGYANFGNTLMHRGKINESKFFDEGLTNSELETLTTI